MAAPGEEVFFLIRWWQEVLAGALVILSGLLLKSKGKADPVYLTEREISNRMTICKQEILLGLNTILTERDEKLIKTMKEILNNHVENTEGKGN